MRNVGTDVDCDELSVKGESDIADSGFIWDGGGLKNGAKATETSAH